MLNLLTSDQIRDADSYTVKKQNIRSIDLMEHAAVSFTDIFTNQFPQQSTSVSIYCGTGNNGGDGLAIARLLVNRGYTDVSVKVAMFSEKKPTAEFAANLKRLKEADIKPVEIKSSRFPKEQASVIIDALLGSGLNRAIEGRYKDLIEHLNGLNKKIVSVDIPSGFCCENHIDDNSPVIHSDLTISFQLPKINFFFPESADAINQFEIADIGLDQEFLKSQESSVRLVQREDAQAMLKPRKPFSHKGTFGHGLIVAGSEQTMGAALLSAEACMQTGAGLTTACIPQQGLAGLNARIPEIMAIVRDRSFSFRDLDRYNAIAAGPGLGYSEETVKLVKEMVLKAEVPMVIDADALNMLSQRLEWLKKLPNNSILTPHMKEFDRLFGNHNNWWDRVETARAKAADNQLIIVLKNRYTFIITPDKQVYINPTGSPSMSTGGMGDVLTGMIVSFLAQGYEPKEAAILGTYIHGYCGENYPGYICPPSALVKNIPLKIAEIMGDNRI